MSAAVSTARGGWRFGVVEGFFGRQWPWEERFAFVDFLREQGFNSWFYAPKNDTSLRREWERPMAPVHRERLAELSARCRAAGIDFGIGLSPYELYRDFSAQKRGLLRDKIAEIDAIAPATLCILFDDMRGDLPDLAACQAEIMAFAADCANAARFALCPTYYSFDPVLERQFGQGPEHYLEELGRLIDPAVDILWTGPRVLSRDYPAAHLREVGGLLGRPPLVWDNYPVNDAKRLAPFLRLRPPERDFDCLRAHSRGLLANPMNQARLSRLPLAGLAAQARGEPLDVSDAFLDACLKQCGRGPGEAIAADLALFQDSGLDGLDAARRDELKRRYGAFGDAPCAREILDWLDGGYAFDPACLT